MNALIATLKIFIPAFLLFFMIGAFSGYNSREKHVIEQGIHDVQVEQNLGAYSLVLECESNHQRIEFSVDSDSWQILGKSNLVSAVVINSLAIPDARFEEYQSIISALLGGATGGVTLQSLLKKPTKTSLASHFKKTIVGIIGGITGYSLGNWAGKNYDTGCKSDIFSRTMNDKQNWLNIEKARLIISMLVLQNMEDAHLSQTGNAVYDWQQDPAFLCSDKLIELKVKFDSLVNTQLTNPSSVHFGLIDKIATLHHKISTTEEYKVLIDNMLTIAQPLNKAIDPNSALAKQMLIRKAKWDQACENVSLI